MSRKGNPYDNAIMESFYRILKRGLVQDVKYDNPEQARMDIFKYIELFTYPLFGGVFGCVSFVKWLYIAFLYSACIISFMYFLICKGSIKGSNFISRYIVDKCLHTFRAVFSHMFGNMAVNIKSESRCIVS